MAEPLAAAATGDPSPGDVLAGKYRVERVVGSGGMGVVVAARHLELDEVVAIKFLRARIDGGDSVLRFQREARAVAKLRSEHVVRVRDVGTLENGLPFMVMDLLEGETLKDRVKRAGPLPFSEAVDYVLQACDAVSEAHAQGIIHRDLKPTNLFLSRRADGRPIVKVFDFGIAKQVQVEPGPAGGSGLDLGMTSTTAMLGSPLYMAPEQMIASRDVDARADIWSLGVSLFFLVTGQLPYQAESMMEIFNMVLGAPPRRADVLSAGVPSGLADVIERCLRRDPAERYPSVSALVHALVPFGTEASIGAGRLAALATPRASGVHFSPAAEGLDVVAGDVSATGERPRRARGLGWVVIPAVAVVAGLVALASVRALSSASAVAAVSVAPAISVAPVAPVASATPPPAASARPPVAPPASAVAVDSAAPAVPPAPSAKVPPAAIPPRPPQRSAPPARSAAAAPAGPAATIDPRGHR